ncbi:MAG TPA: nucleotidyltransferase family protein [Tepidiformaceae bacterium]|nr:nucleotidyltransferase family protein [Tepidiformaceae bacterium]
MSTLERSDLLSRVRDKRDAILAAAARNHAGNVRVFGSVARGTSDSASDVDFLVDLEPGASLFDLGALQSELTDLLSLEVDLVTAAGLRSELRDRVLFEAVPL